MHIYYYVKILTFSCNSFTATDTSECNGEMIRNNIVKSKPNHRQEDPHNIQSEGLTFPHHVVCHGMILCNAEVVLYIIHVWFMTIIIFLIYFLFIRIIFYCDIDMQQNAFVLLCLVDCGFVLFTSYDTKITLVKITFYKTCFQYQLASNIYTNFP